MLTFYHICFIILSIYVIFSSVTFENSHNYDSSLTLNTLGCIFYSMVIKIRKLILIQYYNL